MSTSGWWPAGPPSEAPTKKLVHSLAESELTFEDREAARLAGVEQGRAERVELEAEERARALLATWALESRDMATQYAARVGPGWLALIAESGDRE